MKLSTRKKTYFCRLSNPDRRGISEKRAWAVEVQPGTLTIMTSFSTKPRKRQENEDKVMSWGLIMTSLVRGRGSCERPAWTHSLTTT